MAKELPYFKFEPNQWDNGNIQICSKEEKGIFIDLLSMYWSRIGDLPYKLAVQKICGGNTTALDSLYENKIIDIIEGNIYIKFLSEQLNEFDFERKRNSKNAKDGWEKRRKQKELCDPNATALPKQSDPNAIREEKRREEKRINSKCLFKDSEFYDKLKFKNSFPEWKNEKLKYYYEALDVWSNEGNKKINWIATARTWANRDEKEGKIKFKSTINNRDTDGIL